MDKSERVPTLEVVLPLGDYRSQLSFSWIKLLHVMAIVQTDERVKLCFVTHPAQYALAILNMQEQLAFFGLSTERKAWVFCRGGGGGWNKWRKVHTLFLSCEDLCPLPQRVSISSLPVNAILNGLKGNLSFFITVI